MRRRRSGRSPAIGSDPIMTVRRRWMWRKRQLPVVGLMGGIAALALSIAATALPAAAAEVRAAVASNFLLPLKALVPEFERSSGYTVTTSAGSTGKLYAQIVNGAPFDVFLAADAARPERLVDEGLADRASRFTYARGRLMLWSNDPETAGADCRTLVANTGNGRIAIANTKTAPYGAAAREALHQLDLWDTVSSRIVYGENIGQTFQFVDTRNARFGFVALSQMRLRDADDPTGCGWQVPEAMHAPLEQQAVLLRAGQDNVAARAFLAYLASAGARDEIRRMGYAVD